MTQTNHLYDNRKQIVADFLKQHIQPHNKLSIVSAYFTIYAYDALRTQFDSIESLRFLFGEPRFVQSLDPSKDTAPPFEISQDGLKITQTLQQKKTARECAAWIEKKVEIRSIKKSNLLHGKLYHIEQPGKQHALLGSSNLTVSGLGLGAAPNIELNLAIREPHDLYHLKAWFDDIWQSRDTEDVKQEVLTYLEKLYEDHPPQLIYFKTLFEIFYNDLQRSKDDDDTRQIGLQNTEIWNTLFPFQKDGAKAAIHKINTYRGCILADSVGLGKTFTALAVIKYFLLRNHNVLLLCPKRLKENWSQYLAQNNSKNNPLLKDKFNFTLLSHTDLSRPSGKVGDLNLATLNWGNFDLVVIDESHNFRNDTRPKRPRNALDDTNDQEHQRTRSRYEKLLHDIIQDGLPTKVLLLSATPVNNNLTDLHNQLRLITADHDYAFHESLGIQSLKQTIKRAQDAFNQWSQQHNLQPATTPPLVDSLPASFFHLLDRITIARSRKHILRYYKDSLGEIGLFPTRKKPLSLHPPIDTISRFPSFEEIDQLFRQLHLALYRPFNYLEPDSAHLYLDLDDDLDKRIEREAHLTHMLRISFLKRLESSIYAFTKSIGRFLEQIQSFIATLQAAQQHPSTTLHSPPPNMTTTPTTPTTPTTTTIRYAKASNAAHSTAPHNTSTSLVGSKTSKKTPTACNNFINRRKR